MSESNKDILKSQKEQLSVLNSCVDECNRDFIIISETSKRNGEALKEIKRDIIDMQQQMLLQRQQSHYRNQLIQQQIFEQQQQIFEQQQQMINFTNDLNFKFKIMNKKIVPSFR